jgi:hypothetical protein
LATGAAVATNGDASIARHVTLKTKMEFVISPYPYVFYLPILPAGPALPTAPIGMHVTSNSYFNSIA